jgi:hypothetical protein
MRRTVTIHSVFVTAKLACLTLNTLQDVLHCDKFSWFCHNRGATLRSWAFDVFLARTICGQQWFELGQVVGLVCGSLHWDE